MLLRMRRLCSVRSGQQQSDFIRATHFVFDLQGTSILSGAQVFLTILTKDSLRFCSGISGKRSLLVVGW